MQGSLLPELWVEIWTSVVGVSHHDIPLQVKLHGVFKSFEIFGLEKI